MNPSARSLSAGMQGDDVELLQDDLRQLGFTITIDETDKQFFGETTHQAVLDFQKRHGLEATGDVDEQTAGRINAEVDRLLPGDEPVSGLDQTPFVVRGGVSDPGAIPLPGVVVRAFDKDLRGEDVLGETITGEDGRYEITYTPDQFRRAEKRSADLIVRAFDGEETLTSSATIFNARPVETVDLVIDHADHRGPSEYERSMAELAPVLEDVRVADLTEEDVEFLAGETGLDPGRIRLLVSSARHGEKTDIAPEIFYGLARESLPTDLPTLLTQSMDALRRALEEALGDNIIPSQFRDDLDAILSRLQQLIVRQAFEKPEESGKYPPGDLLDLVLPSREKAEEFLKLYLDHDGPVQEFWRSLRENPEFGEDGLVDRLQFTLQLGALTGNHAPLVRELLESGEFDSARDLVKLDEDAWLALIDRQADGQATGAPPDIPGKDEAQRRRNYALALNRIVEDAFPTPAIAHRVEQEGIPGREHVRPDLVQFFSNSPDFDLGATDIDAYLEEKRETVLTGVDDEENLAKELKGMQRVFKVAPRFREMRPLLRDGLDSARSIARIGEEAFVARYAEEVGGEAVAATIYDLGGQAATTALALLARYGADYNNVELHVTPRRPATVEGIPNWTTLFGSLDLCECEHCRSVYSPAAYLVDLLAFLKDRPSKVAGRRALDILFDRRPDLGGIELSCQNTNTLVPYIDLVNEVLENALSRRYPARNERGEEIWPQTTWTAEELSANPEYTNDEAYSVLAGEVYPHNLPFDLPLAEVRAYLENLGSSRYEILKTFQRGGTPSDVDVACEYLAISAEERRILTGAALDPHRELWQFYGYSSNTLDRLARVPEFLARTAMGYVDLRELLKTWFLNGNRGDSPRVNLTGPECDPSRATIQHLDAAALGRIHRFLRLWRKLGWSLRGLDNVMKALGAIDIDDDALLKLAHVQRLRGELDLPLVELLSLWATIDTGGDDSLYDRLFQNRAVLNPPDAAFELREPDRGELEIVGSRPEDAKISRHAPAILAALRIDAAALAILQASERTGDDLTLENLSRLYRAVVLARSLNLPLRDFLTLKALIGTDERSDPLRAAEPAATASFVDKARKIQRSSFSVAHLRYLYRLDSEPPQGSTPEQVGRLLKEIQDSLSKVASDTPVLEIPPAQTLDLLRRKLASVMDGARIDATIRLLTDSGTYAAALASLPPEITFPASVRERISYDPERRELRFAGVMTEAERTQLRALSPDASYLSAVDDLFSQPGSVTPPVYGSPLAALNGVRFPESLRNKISYHPEAQRLRFVGAMTPDERQTLESLSPENRDYLRSLDDLFRQPRTFIRENMGRFLDADEAIGTLLEDGTLTKEDKFAYVLRYLLPYLQAVIRALGDAYKLDGATTKLVLEELLRSRSDTSRPALADFLSPQGDGLTATYFSDDTLANAAAVRVDAIVDFDWGTGSPHPSIPADRPFGVRWTGRVLAPSAGTYTFYTRSEGRVRLWVDGRLLIDQWTDHPSAEHSGTIELQADQFCEIKLEYARGSGRGSVHLARSGPSEPRAVIPRGRLYSMKAYDLLRRAALLVNTFKMTSPELAHISANRGFFAEFDLNLLDLTDPDAGIAAFKQWQRLCDLYSLRDGLPPGSAGLIDVFGAANLVDARDRLARATGWEPRDLDFLVGPGGFNLTVDDLRNEIEPTRLRACMGLSRRVGVPARELFGWARTAADPAQARAIRSALKARYDDAGWLAVAKPIRDALREQQRTSLASYLVARPDRLGRRSLRDTDELYEHFLIDVEMSSCQRTSRIRQAIGSVQLFVQRCLMNLETSVSLTPEDARQWQWMKNYRVWEANRKVFLYPENWIEPELRDDKTPFFRDLENALLQNEVTAETAETALRNYLEKLDEVARLEVCGMYHQLEQNARGEVAADVIHVFGRTRGNPRVYYYRQWVGEDARWTPWEKVNLDIEGEHLIPIVYERRLYLFWPIFTEKGRKPPTRGEQREGDPIKYWEIKLAWSEYKGDKWSAKKISDQAITVDQQELAAGARGQTPFAYRDLFLFKADIEGGDLVITCGFVFHVDVSSPSFQHRGRFRFTGCHGRVTLQDSSNVEDLILPSRSHIEFMTFEEDSPGEHRLSLPSGDRSRSSSAPTLGATPGTFSLAYPHQFLPDVFPAPFFYQDDTRTFFATPQIPSAVESKEHAWFDPNAITVQEIAGSGDRIDWSDEYLYLAEVLGPDGGSVERDIDPRQLMEEDRVLTTRAMPARYRRANHYRFETFYHPYACLFIRELDKAGIDGLLRRSIQVVPYAFFDPPAPYDTFFLDDYDPTLGRLDPEPQDVVTQPYPVEDVDFELRGAYSQYNWELFFHAPLLIASRLSQNQRFEEAQKWFHYIFNPTDSSRHDVPQRFWKVRKFFEDATGRPIEQLMALLHYDGADPGLRIERENLEAHVRQWRRKPFNPHLIARLRTTAYQKATVMKYLDNLIDWADRLFRQDRPELIEEATQLYVLAAKILGRRPETIPQRSVPVRTYRQLEPLLDDFSNAVIALENVLPSPNGHAPRSGPETQAAIVLAPTFYFCIPRNDKLLEYWDKVADRLFKIRHCMNIEGVVRELPLFEPPIDPALLVRAAAAGVDLGAVLGDIRGTLPHHRFAFMVQKALELCADVRNLGASLLSALEKRDAEELALLRSSHEVNLLSAVRRVKAQQIQEANATLEGLRRAREVTQKRYDYYSELPYMNTRETMHLTQLEAAAILGIVAQGFDLAASIAQLVPDFDVGATGPFPTAKTKYGGTNIGGALQAYSRYISLFASLATHQATKASILGGYDRRQEEWNFQAELAKRELAQVDQQILAAEIRVAIAEHELENHDLQTENARAVDDYMRREKFTNRELYDWMVSQISRLYFQSYQLTYDIAKRTERAYRYELGLTDSGFVQFGHWESLRKGLLAGEKLHHDLKRMEVAYLEQHRREYEITKHVSLAMLDPVALIKLKETGQCFVELPEALFDLDYPGHYMRRIKSASLTIPCVTGPYTGVNCTLTLLSNSVRRNATIADGYRRRGADDPRFADNVGAIQSIATSSAQNDTGVFELNFRDERYLPFEGAGAASRWRIELPRETNHFDLNTVSDVVIHLRYTSRDGGEPLKRAATEAVVEAASSAGKRLFSAKHEFPDDWHRFLHPTGAATEQRLELALTPERFPFEFRDRQVEIDRVELYLKLSDERDEEKVRGGQALTLYLRPPGSSTAFGGRLESAPALLGGIPHTAAPIDVSSASTGFGPWVLAARSADVFGLHPDLSQQVVVDTTTVHRLKPEAIEDLFVICHYRSVAG